MIKRVIFDVVIFLSVLIFPWWITAILGLIGIFIFSKFYEFIVVGFSLYALYTIPGLSFLSSPVWFTIILLSLYTVIQYIRRYIILYKNEISY